MFERVRLSALLRVFRVSAGSGVWRIALYVVGPIDILPAHVSGDSDANTPAPGQLEAPSDGGPPGLPRRECDEGRGAEPG